MCVSEEEKGDRRRGKHGNIKRERWLNIFSRGWRKRDGILFSPLNYLTLGWVPPCDKTYLELETSEAEAIKYRVMQVGSASETVFQDHELVTINKR